MLSRGCAIPMSSFEASGDVRVTNIPKCREQLHHGICSAGEFCTDIPLGLAALCSALLWDSYVQISVQCDLKSPGGKSHTVLQGLQSEGLIGTVIVESWSQIILSYL